MKQYALYVLFASFLTHGWVCAQNPVDLGLSVQWADMNVGAKSCYEYGEYVSWGETAPKHFYGEKYPYAHYKYDASKKGFLIYKYNSQPIKGCVVDNLEALESSDDFAYVKDGHRWRIPSQAQVEELRDKCTWRYVVESMCHGYRVTGPSGNSIFLPLGGFMVEDFRCYGGSYGCYWTLSVDVANSRQAVQLQMIGAKGPVIVPDERSKGALIRAVYR